MSHRPRVSQSVNLGSVLFRLGFGLLLISAALLFQDSDLLTVQLFLLSISCDYDLFEVLLLYGNIGNVDDFDGLERLLGELVLVLTLGHLKPCNLG